jgi:hypothetical protein
LNAIAESIFRNKAKNMGSFHLYKQPFNPDLAPPPSKALGKEMDSPLPSAVKMPIKVVKAAVISPIALWGFSI